MDKKGISLVALVITIIVLIILTGAVIITAFNNNIFGNASEAVFKSDIATFREELTNNIQKRKLDNLGSFDESSINATSNGTGDGDIRTWIPSISDEYAQKLKIQAGKLVFIGEDTTEQGYATNLGMDVQSTTGGGSGDEEPPITPVIVTPAQDGYYHITSIEDYAGVVQLINADADYFEGETVVLDNDINFGGSVIPAISYFNGIFDGGDNTITINNYTTFDISNNSSVNEMLGGTKKATAIIGILLGTVEDLNIRGTMNISLTDNTISLGGTSSLVAINIGTVTGCSSSVNMIATKTYEELLDEDSMCATGNIVGVNVGTVENCYNTGSIDDNTYSMTGGIVGLNISSISNCYNTGSIKGTNETGGISGGTATGGSISNCYNTGTITSYVREWASAGGISGYIYEGTIENSYNIGTIIMPENPLNAQNFNSVTYIEEGTINHCYYLSGQSITDENATPKTSSEIASPDFLALLNGQSNVWQSGSTHPIFNWQ